MRDEISLTQVEIKAKSEHLTGYNVISQGLTAVNDTLWNVEMAWHCNKPFGHKKNFFLALHKRRVLPTTASEETAHMWKGWS